MVTLSLLHVEKLFLLFVRTTAIIMFIPVLGARRVPIRVKLGLSAFVSVLMFPLVEHTSYIPGIFLFVMTIWREILIGIVLGLVVRLLFGGIQLGGQMMGFKMGFGIVNVFDIQSNQQVSIVTNFIYMLAVLIFLCINGHHVCLVVLAKSFEIVTPGQFHFSSELSHMILALGKDMYIIALKIGFKPFALSLSKGRSWFDKPVLSLPKDEGGSKLRRICPTIWVPLHYTHLTASISFLLSVSPLPRLVFIGQIVLDCRVEGVCCQQSAVNAVLRQPSQGIQHILLPDL